MEITEGKMLQCIGYILSYVTKCNADYFLISLRSERSLLIVIEFVEPWSFACRLMQPSPNGFDMVSSVLINSVVLTIDKFAKAHAVKFEKKKHPFVRNFFFSRKIPFSPFLCSFTHNLNMNHLGIYHSIHTALCHFVLHRGR